MNRYSLLAIGLTAVLGLASCSSSGEQTVAEMQSQQPTGRISFTLGGSATTRAAAATTSLDYEANIKNVYVVAYKNNRLTKAVKATETAGSYYADVEASGVLDVYFIANVEEGDGKLSSRILALAANSQSSALEALTADQTAGAYQATATDGFFPMIGKLSSVTVNTQNDPAVGTPLGSVTLKRLAARIDIDDVMPANFTITGVTVNKRYNQSLLARSIGNLDMSGCGTATGTQNYTVTPTELPYHGHIYLYEDMTDGGAKTEIVIHGTYLGHNVNPVVTFGTTNVVRNNIYNVKLSQDAPDGSLQDLIATITVKDWDTGEVIAKTTTALTDRTTAPSVTFDNLVNCTETSGNLTSTDATAVTFTVKVHNTSSTLSKLVCITPSTGEGITIVESPIPTYNADGSSDQSFAVSITANTTDAARVFTLRAENLLKKSTGVQFTVTQAAP